MAHFTPAQVTLLLVALSLLSYIPSARCGQPIPEPRSAEQQNDQAYGEDFVAPARQVSNSFKESGFDVEQANLPKIIRDGVHSAASDTDSSPHHTPAASQPFAFSLLPPFAPSSHEAKPHRAPGSDKSGERRPTTSNDCSLCIQNTENNVPTSSDATMNESQNLCSPFKIDPVKFHCKYLGQRTKDAIIHLALAIVSLPLHTALGIAGGMAACVGGVGFCCCLRMPEEGCHHLSHVVAAPALGLVGGAGLSALSACVTVGDIIAALYELSMIPIAACRRFVKGKASEKELEECKVRYEEWKELHDNREFRAAHDMLLGETLGFT